MMQGGIFSVKKERKIEYMADTKTEKQKVKEIADKLEEGLKELSQEIQNYPLCLRRQHLYAIEHRAAG